MQSRVNRYASLRAAQAFGQLSPEMAVEMNTLKATLPEWAVEDAECRLEAIMPTVSL